MTEMVLSVGFAPLDLLAAAVLHDGVDVGPPGHEVRVAWASAPGATGADVTAGGLRIGAATTQVPLGALAVADAGDAVDVLVPGGRRIGALVLSGLRLEGGDVLRSAADFAAHPEGGTLRLVVFTQLGGTWVPLCAVPGPGPRGVLPAQLGGATYAGSVLTLPDPAAPRLRLQLVRGDTPESFAGQRTELAGAHGSAAVPTAGLTLTGPDGTVIWAFPGELPAAGQSVDLRVPARLALEAALAAGAPPDVAFRLSGPAGVRATVAVDAVRGALVRTLAGIVATPLTGDPAPLALPAGAPALAPEAPGAATADVAVRYAGIRLHDAIRDPVPAAPGGVGGPVVGSVPEVRVLPPAALSAHPVARASPVGRAPDGCALSVELVDLTAGPPGVPLAPPATLELPPSRALAAPWAAFGDLPAFDGPCGVAVRTTSGRFLWAAGADGVPLLRLAVRDPDPGGRPVRVGAEVLAAVEEPETVLPRHAVPPAPLRGPAAPVLSSDLFCTVELADLELRHPR